MTPKETPTLDISGVLPPECLYARGRFAFELQAMPPEGRLRIAARQWGRVWLNGVPLGRIFVRHHEDEWRYHEFDLLPHLRVGRNVVGVLLHSVGSPGIHIPGTQPRQPILMRASSGTVGSIPTPRRRSSGCLCAFRPTARRGCVGSPTRRTHVHESKHNEAREGGGGPLEF